MASDVDLDDTGRVLSRLGQTVISATAAHSLYSDGRNAFLVEGQTLKALEADLSRTAIRVLSTSAPVSYETYGDVTYYSNGIDTGRLVGRTHGQWGVVPPVGQPQAAATVGYLPAGQYQYAVTYRRSDGHESGTGMAGMINLPTGGGISLSGIEVSTNPEIDAKIVYVSGPNGETLFKARVLLASTTAALITEQPYGLELSTQLAQQAPVGTMVRQHAGMMVVVQGNVAYFSDPYNPELFRLETSFLRFGGDIAVLESVNGGLFVATADAGRADDAGETYYIAGNKLGSMTAVRVLNYGAIPGTAVRTLAGYFEPSTDQGDSPHGGSPAVIWATRHGVCFGVDGGAVKNLTENMYSLPPARSGAALVRQTRGFVQYLTVLRGAGTLNNAA